jgi:hypothetical protein
VIGGHCGGAITAFYAASARPTHRPDGIFALDLIFTLALETSPATVNPHTLKAPEGWRLRFSSFRDEIRAALLKTSMGDSLQMGAQKMRRLLSNNRNPHLPPDHKHTLPNSLPPQTNEELLKRVQLVLHRRTKVLFVAAIDPRKNAEFDYLDYLLSDGPMRAQYKKIPGTDHGFLAGNGRSKVIEHVSDWFETEFRKPPFAK